MDYLFLALLLIIFSSSYVSFSELTGIGLRWTELFLNTKGFNFMPGRKQYKLEKKTYLQAEGNATFPTSSTATFSIDQRGHLHLPVSLLGPMHESALWSVPLPTQHGINPRHPCPTPGSSQAWANTNTNPALRIITIINTTE